MMKKAFLRTEKQVYALILVAVLLLFVLVNLFASLAVERWGLRFDTTDIGLYELSDTTRGVAEELGTDTEIYVLDAEEDYPVMLRELLSRYEQLSGHIRVQYIDPYENPVFLDTYRQQGITLDQSDLLVTGQSGAKRIAYEDLLVYSGEEFTGIRLEQQVTSAMIYVNTGSHASVLFVSGHNERSTQSLEAVFTGNNYTVTTGALTESAVAQTDLVVLACPTKDLSDEEAAVLASYLQAGGRVMAFFEPGVNEYPKLSALLADWGLSLRNDTVFDSQYSVSGNPTNVVPLMTTHEINAYFEENQYFLVMPSSRSIELLSTVSDLKVTPLLLTSTSGYAKEGSQYTSTQQESDDRTGNLVLAAISERTDGGALLLVASRYIYADDIMSADSYGNRAFLAQAADYLSGNGSAVSIPAKQLSAPLLAVTGEQELLCGAVFVVLLPLGVLAAGAVIVLKRRKL